MVVTTSVAMTSVSNMMLHTRGTSLGMAGIARAAIRNKQGNRFSAISFFQNGVAPHISFAAMEDKNQHRTLSTYKISTGKHRLDHSDPNSSISAQRRLRSALPEEYYDDHIDEASASPVAHTPMESKPFLLADIGEGIAEVELLRWFVKEGQVISEFDPVCEVQSDKATVEITSRFDGKIQKLAYSDAGNMIKVGEPILWILEEGRDRNTKQDEQQEYSKTAVKDEAPATAHSSTRDETVATVISEEPSLMNELRDSGEDSLSSAPSKVLTSPAVRKLARDNRLNLSSIDGTGPSGRILKGDILAVLKATDLPMMDDQVSSTENIDANQFHQNSEESDRHFFGENQVVPLRGYNRIMADTMAASLKIPHMVYSDEINLNRFVKYKLEQQQLDHHSQQENSKKLLFLPLAVKAASKALEKYPWLNASFDEDKYEATLWKDHNIGIAMDTPRGLIVPVIKECQNKSLPELAEELKRLKEAVVEGVGGLPAEDLKGATFTLSNVGAIGGGGTYMSPIITPPQVAIGALGQIRRLPRFVTPSSTDPTQSQTIEEAHICAVSWAADHRVVDGATVARFHKAFKEYMEDPIKLLLELR